MFLQFDWSPRVANSIDWTQFGKSHQSIQGPTVDNDWAFASDVQYVEGIIRRSLQY